MFLLLHFSSLLFLYWITIPCFTLYLLHPHPPFLEGVHIWFQLPNRKGGVSKNLAKEVGEKDNFWLYLTRGGEKGKNMNNKSFIAGIAIQIFWWLFLAYLCLVWFILYGIQKSQNLLMIPYTIFRCNRLDGCISNNRIFTHLLTYWGL